MMPCDMLNESKRREKNDGKKKKGKRGEEGGGEDGEEEKGMERVERNGKKKCFHHSLAHNWNHANKGSELRTY